MRGVGRGLTYAVGADMVGLDGFGVGSLVRIPLGRRVELGIVMGEGEEAVPEARLKRVLGLVQPFPVVRPEGVQLAIWLARYYACGLEQVFEVMIPGAVRRGMGRREGRAVRLNRSAVTEEALKGARKQREVVEFLSGQLAREIWPRALLMKRLAVSGVVLDGLVKKGVLEESLEVTERVAYGDELGAQQVGAAAHGHDLTEEQAVCVKDILESVEKRQFVAHLLHGVTGSGKTEVYMRVMKEVLAAGGGVIFLVPEVALTPQTVGRLRARFEAVSGDRVVVWHSQLSDGERYDGWRAVANGEARVVVGARSAVFAPVRNLKLVVVDEEHEPAYKQEEVPRYNGRDVAVYRAMLNEAVCLLGSATPSMETLHNVAIGKYRENRLRKRIDERQLPLMHVVDMRREKAGVFSRLLADKMRERYERREQVILFLNRRGHDTSLNCPDCGFVAECDFCSITLTHHFRDRRLRCHMCGFETGVPSVCPKCRSPKIHYKGTGTEKVEAHVKRLLPMARVARIDADTTRRKHALREQLEAFRQGRLDVLVGTQMIAKGLDFPNVTLVGLLDADLSMHMPDFRAAERTFQLVVQVSGRAGRGDRAGEVVLQTYLPSAPPIQYGRQQDFDGFTELELKQRREFGYPPYRHLIHHLFRAANREKLDFYTRQWVRHVEPGLKERGVEVRGPAPCPVERIQNLYRYQIWYFAPSVTRVVPWLQEQRTAFKWDPEMVEVLDVDAMQLS
jgi:primosomal protein N' (replication factor Y)